MPERVPALYAQIRRENRVGRAILRSVLVVDVAIGLLWIFGPQDVPRQASAVTSLPTIGVVPMAFGIPLLAGAVATLALMQWRSEFATRLFLLLTGLCWVAFGAGIVGHGRSPERVVFIALNVVIILIGHLRGIIGTGLLTKRNLLHEILPLPSAD